MLSISGMLGPPSLQSQRPLWYDYRSEQLLELEKRYFNKSLEADNMPLPPEHRGSQTSRGTSTSSELGDSSPGASLSSGSPMGPFGEEVCGASALCLRGGGGVSLKEVTILTFQVPRSVIQSQHQTSAPSEPEAKSLRCRQ